MTYSKLKKKIYSGLVALICSLTAGCAKSQFYIPDNPLAICQSSIEAIDDLDLVNFYKTYFPENRAELSYKVKTKNKDFKFFINPGASNNRASILSGGLEIRY